MACVQEHDELGMIFFVLLLYGFDSIEGIFGCSISSMITDH